MVDGKPVTSLEWTSSTEWRSLGTDLHPANTDWSFVVDSKLKVAIATHTSGRVVLISFDHLAYE